MHNFRDQAQWVSIKLEGPGAERLVGIFDKECCELRESGQHEIELGPYGWKWLRIGAIDASLDELDE